MNSQSDGAERLPPQAVEAEAAVLGAMLLEQDAISIALEILDDTAFYRDAHRKIFNAIIALYDRNEPTDVITLSEELEKRNELPAAGGSFYLVGLTEGVSTAANVEYHARIVLEKSQGRKLINVATQIASRAYESSEDTAVLLDDAERMVFSLSQHDARRGFTQLNPILHDTFENIEKLHEQDTTVTGVPTGFTRLDEMTAGFQRGDLVIIAARPAMGKTALCLNIIRHVAVEARVGVGLFSLEMTSHQLAQRMLCSEARVDSHLMRTGRLPGDAWSNLSIAVGALATAPVYIDETPALSVTEMRSRARRLMSEHDDIGMLAVDYMQLMRGPSDSENRQQEISAISRNLKALAKELDVPIMALSQLSRAVETRGGDGRPQLSDLRESGAIEQDADVVLFIYRPIRYAEGEEQEQNQAEIIIGKQRNGPVGTVDLIFVDRFARFENPDFYHEDPG